MKIKITREKKEQYFAEILGDLGVHAVGKTPELAVEYLIDVYKQIINLRQEKLSKRFLIDYNISHSSLLKSPFRSLTLSI